MSHYQIPTINYDLLNQYYALFRGDESIAQPETATWEYLIALVNMMKADEAAHNVSLLVIDTVTPEQLDYFFHGDFNSGNFEASSAPMIELPTQIDLIGSMAWEAM